VEVDRLLLLLKLREGLLLLLLLFVLDRVLDLVLVRLGLGRRITFSSFPSCKGISTTTTDGGCNTDVIRGPLDDNEGKERDDDKDTTPL